MLEDYKDILERALRIETEIQRTDIRKEGRKKYKVEETTKPETKKNKEGAEQRRNFPCTECGRHHGGMCYKKTGACYDCGKTGHQFFECPDWKDTTKPIGPPEQDKRGKGRVFSLTDQ